MTGCEAYFVADTDAYSLKKLSCELEDYDELGRLYDMDVLYLDPVQNTIVKMERQETLGQSRDCLICGAKGRDCASRRIHSVSELQRKTKEILVHAITGRERSKIAEYAVRALLYEVSATPKPGLVDRDNSGSHRDMDFYTFLNSAASLWPYFEACARLGQETADQAANETFKALRNVGKRAENRMLYATGGVNTHKGAIFSMGIVTAAAGRLSVALDGDRQNAERILKECAEMVNGITRQDFSSVTKENARTVGEQLYAEYGITGIRGQMEAGLPSVAEYGLPLLKKLLKEGRSNDEAGAVVLMELLAHTTDTNMIHRSSVDIQEQEAKRISKLLDRYPNQCPDRRVIREIDREYIERNLSPGGSADLLAVCWFLYTWEQEGKASV